MIGSLALILVSIVFAVAGQILLKSGMNQVAIVQTQQSVTPVQIVRTVVTTPTIVAGFLCYGLGAIFWLIVLSRVDLSFAYPMLALMYVLIPLSARIFLHEEISAGRWLGIGVVIVGVMILAYFGE